MWGKKLGNQTIELLSLPGIKATGVIGGPKEGEGPLRQYFDELTQDELLNTSSWEQAESEYLIRACKHAVINCTNLSTRDIEYFISGDLLNQTVSSNLAAKELGVPYYGLFGACSTMTEGLLLSAVKVDGGYAENVLTGTSSHNKGAERQFRFPVEYGGQRPPYAQWTVSGAAAAVVSIESQGPKITRATTGKVVDWGVTDAYDLGSAMAPAAYNTLTAHLEDTGNNPSDYDLIVTGDLGMQGTKLFKELCSDNGLDISINHEDCGVMIYNDNQDVHSGASGCACSAIGVYGYIYQEMKQNNLKRVLVLATGALHNPQIVQQNFSIPTICHGVVLETSDQGDDN